MVKEDVAKQAHGEAAATTSIDGAAAQATSSAAVRADRLAIFSTNGETKTAAIARAAEMEMTTIGRTAVEATTIGMIVANAAGVTIGTTFIVIAAMIIVKMIDEAPALRSAAAVKATRYMVKPGVERKDSELADTTMAIGSADVHATFISRRVGATVRSPVVCLRRSSVAACSDS